MSVTAQPSPPPAAEDLAIPTEPIYRLSVAQYHAMAEHGILDEDTPVELLEGWLVQKMAKHRPHSRCTHRTPTPQGRPPDHREQKNYGPEDEIPVVLDGKEIGRLPVRDLLP